MTQRYKKCLVEKIKREPSRLKMSLNMLKTCSQKFEKNIGQNEYKESKGWLRDAPTKKTLYLTPQRRPKDTQVFIETHKDTPRRSKDATKTF